MDINVYDKNNPLDQFSEDDVVQFLYEALERFGDPKTDIQRCLNYALENISSFGGKVIIASENEKIGGAVIINNTGMKGYIPEHILVYIAVGPDQRGKGLGKTLMKKAEEVTEGDIALHVEEDNPALHLYQKVGYENKYLEMRLSK